MLVSPANSSACNDSNVAEYICNGFTLPRAVLPTTTIISERWATRLPAVEYCLASEVIATRQVLTVVAHAVSRNLMEVKDVYVLECACVYAMRTLDRAFLAALFYDGGCVLSYYHINTTVVLYLLHGVSARILH